MPQRSPALKAPCASKVSSTHSPLCIKGVQPTCASKVSRPLHIRGLQPSYHWGITRNILRSTYRSTPLHHCSETACSVALPCITVWVQLQTVCSGMHKAIRISTSRDSQVTCYLGQSRVERCCYQRAPNVDHLLLAESRHAPCYSLLP